MRINPLTRYINGANAHKIAQDTYNIILFNIGYKDKTLINMPFTGFEYMKYLEWSKILLKYSTYKVP